MKRISADVHTCLRPAKLFSLRLPVFAAACAFAVTSAGAQAAHHGAAPHHLKKNSGATSKKSVGPIPERPPIVLQLGLPPVLSPEKMPPKVPQVIWDGKLLSIDSENSTLADILIAVKTQTGADLDIPPNASRERVAARLGPGPAREVLSTLLGGTDFDYVIQASDGDPDGVRSVLLTPREKDGTALARGGANGLGDSVGREAIRRLARPNGSTEEPTTAENSSVAQTETAAEPPRAATQTAGQDSPPAVASAQTPPDETAAAPANTTLAPTDVASAAAPADSNSNPPPVSETQQRIQQMQDLFQQRKQMLEDAHKPASN